MASSVLFPLIIIFTILQGLTLITNGNSQEPELDCIPSIRVPRYTVWKAPESTTIKINCTVYIESHCWMNLLTSWCRINDENDCRPMNHSTHTATEWRNINGSQRMFFLIFKDLSMRDAGLYRCQTHAPVFTSGHAINVTVTEYNTDSEVVINENKTNNTTNGTRVESSDMTWLLPYVYICSGIVGLVLTVMVVAVLLIRCQGSKQSRKEQIAENQFTPSFTPPVRGTLLPGNTNSLPAQLSPSSDCIYDNAPVTATSQRDRPSRGHPANHMANLSRRRDHFSEEVEDEDNPLVYASLNHNVMPRPPVRVTLPEETSEYAAIRVS